MGLWLLQGIKKSFSKDNAIDFDDLTKMAGLAEPFKFIIDPDYSGFLNPTLTPVMENGQIVDVKIDYSSDFTSQMLEYSEDYGFLESGD